MKNTAPIRLTDGGFTLVTRGAASRWGALPFLCWLAAAGMPLQRSLEVSEPVWIADLHAANLAATSNASSLQSVPFVLFMTTIYICAGLLVMGKPKTTFSILLRQWPLLLLLLFVAASMLWSPNKEKVLMNVAHSVGGLLVTLSAVLRYRTNPLLLPKHIGYVLGLNIAVHLASILLLPAFTIEWDGRWRGLSGQANGLGAIAFCTFWANAAALIGAGKDRYHLHLVLAACAVAAMLGANSVTSMVSSICALTITYIVAGSGSRYEIGKRIFIGGVAAVILLAAVGVVFLGDALDLGKLLGLAGRSGNFTGRTEIWIQALKAIIGHPWFGWGFDDNAYLIKTTGLPYTTYHNGFLDLMARGGLIATGLFFLLLGNWLLQLPARARLARHIVPFAIPFIVSMLVYNLMEATLVAPRDQMWLIFLVILFLGGCRKWSPSPVVYSQPWPIPRTRAALTDYDSLIR